MCRVWACPQRNRRLGVLSAAFLGTPSNTKVSSNMCFWLYFCPRDTSVFCWERTPVCSNHVCGTVSRDGILPRRAGLTAPAAEPQEDASGRRRPLTVQGWLCCQPRCCSRRKS